MTIISKVRKRSLSLDCFGCCPLFDVDVYTCTLVSDSRFRPSQAYKLDSSTQFAFAFYFSPFHPYSMQFFIAYKVMMLIGCLWRVNVKPGQPRKAHELRTNIIMGEINKKKEQSCVRSVNGE